MVVAPNLLGGMGNYVIWTGETGQVLVMANNLMIFGYTYAKIRLKIPPTLSIQSQTLAGYTQIIPRGMLGIRTYEGETNP